MGNQPLSGRLKQALVHSLIISLCVAICFLGLHFTMSGLLITSLAASAFIAFAFPVTESSRPKYLVGGYACGIVAGLIAYAIMNFLMPSLGIMAVGAVISVFIASFLMIILSLQHPPSAALAVSIVIDDAPLTLAIASLCCILLLALLKIILLRTVWKERAQP